MQKKNAIYFLTNFYPNMKADIHSLYEKSKKGDLVATHEGEIDSDLITEYLSKVESSLLQSGELAKVIRKPYKICFITWKFRLKIIWTKSVCQRIVVMLFVLL